MGAGTPLVRGGSRSAGPRLLGGGNRKTVPSGGIPPSPGRSVPEPLFLAPLSCPENPARRRSPPVTSCFEHAAFSWPSLPKAKKPVITVGEETRGVPLTVPGDFEGVDRWQTPRRGV